jgi:predicted kinase
MKLFVLVGLPASGKSTFAKTFCENNKNFIRLNRDDIRSMFGVLNSFTKENENLVVESQLVLLEKAFKKGFSVILDNTNFNPEIYKKIDLVVNKYNVDVEFKYFDTPLEECIKRNSERENQVPKDVIYNMFLKWVKGKTPQQIIDKVKSKTSEMMQRFEPYYYHNENSTNLKGINSGTKDAIIVDIDGTIAFANNRNIYDYSKVHLDDPNKEILDIIKCYTDILKMRVIIVSGRKSDSSEQTKVWLEQHLKGYEHLYMRNEKDNRCDSIIKEEIYNNYIKDKFNVVAVFDDRNRVVDMWRKNGLKVLQVAEGDF